MKSKVFSLLAVNIIAITFLIISTPEPASADFVKNWWDDFVPCDWIDGNYWEHECHPNGPYPICIEQSCVGYVTPPID